MIVDKMYDAFMNLSFLGLARLITITYIYGRFISVKYLTIVRGACGPYRTPAVFNIINSSARQ